LLAFNAEDVCATVIHSPTLKQIMDIYDKLESSGVLVYTIGLKQCPHPIACRAKQVTWRKIQAFQ